uniref:Uncharacterized protein n=1 Tax=Zea mays TaxID=4577 RepID=C0PMG0_MAIZE|nr:unknown [Zea mays]
MSAMQRSEQRRAGQPDRHHHRRGDPDGQGVAQPPGVRRRRLRLLLLPHPDRDPGHHPGAAAVGVDGDEARHGGERGGHHALLHAVRLHGVRGVRRRRAREPPHGLRLLRALLAPGRGQRRHRGPPGRRLPGLLPAAVRLRGEVGRAAVAGLGVHHRGGRGPAPAPGEPAAVLQGEPVPGDVADGVRRGHDGRVHAAALLQRRGGLPGRARLLAAHRLLPRRDVRGAEEGAAVELPVGVPADAQPRLPRHLHRRRSRVHRRHRVRPQSLPPVQVLLIRFTAYGRRSSMWYIGIY